MRLKYARIVNFRSIHDVRIDFDPTCRILVGINESGKSNILRALSMIGSEFPLTAEDIREPLPRETPITQAHIWFVFALEALDVERLFASALQRSLTKNPDHELLPVLKTPRIGVFMEPEVGHGKTNVYERVQA